MLPGANQTTWNTGFPGWPDLLERQSKFRVNHHVDLWLVCVLMYPVKGHFGLIHLACQSGPELAKLS